MPPAPHVGVIVRHWVSDGDAFESHPPCDVGLRSTHTLWIEITKAAIDDMALAQCGSVAAVAWRRWRVPRQRGIPILCMGRCRSLLPSGRTIPLSTQRGA
jgi:hypothetical protein